MSSEPETNPDPVTPESFRRACARFATGITVATVRGTDGAPHGLTVNSFTSVSLAPPLVLLCVDHRVSILPHFQRASHYGIGVLAETQEALSTRFAQRYENRFEGLDWHWGETGVPLLRGCLASFECRLERSIDAGDHAILLGEVVNASYRSGRPLLYFGSRYERLADGR